MDEEQEERRVALDTLKKYGVRWAVLAAMRVDMAKQGIEVPQEVDEALRDSHVKLASGCFSPCEVGMSLSKVEGLLVSRAYLLGEERFREWFNLLGQSMQGQIDPSKISEIPILKPVEMDCKFLGCSCS